MSRPIIIGLTGSFGSGKSTAAAMFAKHGAKVIDADLITRRLLQENKKVRKKVAKLFPGAILMSGGVNRKALAKVVFQNPRELKKLTDILYPEAFKEVKRQISLYNKAHLIVLDVPLLFEAGWQKLAGVTVVVAATRRQQVQRARKRLGLSKAEVAKRLKLQLPITKKLAWADMIIDNRGTVQSTRQQVDAVVNRLNTRKQ